MLRPPNSQKPFFGVFVEHECPRCHRAVELPLGELCGECRQTIAKRSARTARLVAVITTILVALYMMAEMPADRTARTVGAMAVISWYIIVNLVVRRVLTRHWR